MKGAKVVRFAYQNEFAIRRLQQDHGEDSKVPRTSLCDPFNVVVRPDCVKKVPPAFYSLYCSSPPCKKITVLSQCPPSQANATRTADAFLASIAAFYPQSRTEWESWKPKPKPKPKASLSKASVEYVDIQSIHSPSLLAFVDRGHAICFLSLYGVLFS